MKLKKLTAMLLATAMTVGVVNVGFAEEKTEDTKVEAMGTWNVSDTDVKYEVDGGYIYFDKSTGTITGADSKLTSVVIPEKIDGTTVTSISGAAFDNNYALQSITLPNTIKSIGLGAFSVCTALTGITIPDSVESIGDLAFECCTNLEYISVSENNNYYKSVDGVLYNKDKTILYTYPAKRSGKTFNIPNTVTKIYQFAFSYCDELENITIPNSVNYIDYSAFSDCSNLKSIIIPDSVTYIGDNCFFLCSSLTSVTLPNTITSIGLQAFDECSNLTNIVIPNSVTSIAESAFCGCKSLTNLIIPDSVTSVGNRAFVSCDNLSTITIPASVVSIGKYWTFSGNGIKTVYCYKGSVADDISLYPDGAQIIYLDSIQTESTTITTETTTESTTTTTESTTESTTEATTIAIFVTGGNIYFNPDTQQIVGCDSSVTAIEIPESVNGVIVSGISEKAFADCVALESISIPNSVKTISKNAFANCTALKTITCEKGSVADNAELYPTTTEITYTKPEFISGDASGDGQLTAEDAALVLQKSLNLAFVTGIEEKNTDYVKYLDVSGDGSITADDAAQILQKTLDKSFKFSSEA